MEYLLNLRQAVVKEQDLIYFLKVTPVSFSVFSNFMQL